MHFALLADAAADQRVIKAMLIVGLIFCAVIAIGETTHWLLHRGAGRRRSR
jgi:hypothetical protein